LRQKANIFGFVLICAGKGIINMRECQSCAHCTDSKCRAMPPQIVWDDGDAMAVWPQVQPTDSCAWHVSARVLREYQAVFFKFLQKQA